MSLMGDDALILNINLESYYYELSFSFQDI